MGRRAGSGRRRSRCSACCCCSTERAEPVRHARMKVLRVLLLMLGLALLGVLVAKNDPAEIFASIGRLSWRLGILVCFPATLVAVFDTLGWRFAFLRDRVGFRTLLGARMAGE